MQRILLASPIIFVGFLKFDQQEFSEQEINICAKRLIGLLCEDLTQVSNLLVDLTKVLSL